MNCNAECAASMKLGFNILADCFQLMNIRTNESRQFLLAPSRIIAVYLAMMVMAAARFLPASTSAMMFSLSLSPIFFHPFVLIYICIYK